MSRGRKEGREAKVYLTTHSSHLQLYDVGNVSREIY